MITIKQKVHFHRGNAGRRQLATKPPATEAVSTGRVPRISKLMALAIRFDRLIREGKATNQSELARLAHITQPRMTQIMNLLHLAPDIQEELLYLPPVMDGRTQIHEKMLRPLSAEISWKVQRRSWGTIMGTPGIAQFPQAADQPHWSHPGWRESPQTATKTQI